MKTSTIKALAFVMAVCPLTLAAQTVESSEEPVSKNTYRFRQAETPQYILPYSTTAYSIGNLYASTMSGVPVHVDKDQITNSAMNPTGINFSLITRNKKGECSLSVYNTFTKDRRVFKLDTKKYGSPTAAVFTPDARRIAVATDKGIMIFETKKFELVDRIDLVPVTPYEMAISNNGYFLSLTDGSKIVLYNLEEKTIRKRWDFEVKVTDASFSSDSQLFGVLTADGLLSVFDTRTFNIRTSVDDLGEGLDFAFNDNAKYVAVATSSDKIEIINLLKQEDRRSFEVTEGGISDVQFVKDAAGNTVLIYGSTLTLNAERLHGLEPYYAKLVSDEVDLLMGDWSKMRPGETMEEYAARVNDATRQKQRRLFEDEISTRLAGDLMSMNGISLGKYNRDKGLLELDFTSMPPVYLPVAESDISAFHSGEDLSVTDAQYGLLPDDSFELIYARFHNRNDGKTYVYDNLERVPMTFLQNDENIVSLEILQQQQLEEMKLQQIKDKVIAEAKHDNVISEHTNISVDSRVVPDYDANGNKILNYVVKFTYQVDPEFSATEDFAPGKYTISESGAARAMLSIVKQAFEGDFAQYIKDDRKLKVNISGTADATPIVRGIPYNGVFGDFEDEPIRQDGQLSAITVTSASGVKTNEQLAFLRAVSVRDYLEKNVENLNNMNRDYSFDIAVSKDKGSEHRRITAEFTFVDAF